MKRDKNATRGSRAATSATRIAAARRREECVQMRLAGHSIGAIAAAVKLSPSTVHAHLTESMAQAVARIADTNEEIRRIEIDRLDLLLVSVWADAMSGSVLHTDRALRIMERRAKLLGLDAPVRAELTGRDGGPMERRDYVDPRSLTEEELDTAIAIVEAAERRAASG